MPGDTLYQNTEAIKHGLMNFKQAELQKPPAYVTICLEEWHGKISVPYSLCGGVIGVLNRL